MESLKGPGPGGFFVNKEGISYFSSTGKAAEERKGDLVTGTAVEAESEYGFDLEKLTRDFGCYKITDELIKQIETVTGEKPHRFIRRGIFFCHRDLDICLNGYAKMKPFFLYTGRGPSAESLHLGHTVPFIFT